MCGIIGAISKKDTSDFGSRFSAPMNDALNHMAYRGPDHKGFWSDERVIFGHRRLSIIDLSEDGNQPFHSGCGNYIIVFNGEIYNYQELRADLRKLGHKFRTESDTEVIISAYKQYGMVFPNYLRGMFAMVIYDRKQGELIFARDRLGKKPLFIYESEDELIFSSEIKFFHAFQHIPLEIDQNSLLNYLSLQYIPGPQSIYRNIRQLKPAELRRYNLNSRKSESQTYWNIFDKVGKRKDIPAIEEIDELLQKSIRYRLVANVDIGLLLSGGIDSSLLACYMHDLAGKKVKAFNVGFAESSLDESSYAKQVARSMDLDLISLRLEDLSAENFSRSIYHGDQPLGDSAIIPTYLISKSIGQHVKVVLSGEGADELFHGYSHYRLEKYFYSLGKLPFEAAGLLFNGLSELGIHKFDKIKNKLRSINTFKKDTGTSRWTSIMNPDLCSRYLSPDHQSDDSYENLFHRYLQQFRQNAGKLESSLMLDLLTWLPDDLLVKTDRMMMACSVEARTPYLDHELVETVLASSGHFVERPFQSKNYLRDLLRQKLPPYLADTIANRSKQGFETPKMNWINSGLSELSGFLFSEGNLKSNPYLNSAKISTLCEENQQEKPGANKRLLWNVFCFLEWYRQHETKFGFDK